MKHLSLDFWNTLGIPNPKYAEARNLVLAMEHGVSVEAAAGIYAEVKATIDRTHCATARPLSWEMCHELLNERFGNRYNGSRGARVADALAEAFKAWPPTLLPGAVNALIRMQTTGMTLSITSNTNFIRGALIRDVVLAPAVRFDFYLFSDEVGYAKPHPEMFGRLIERADLTPKEIVHMGDSVECDVQGAERAGIRRIWVADPQAAAEELTLMAQRREMLA